MPASSLIQNADFSAGAVGWYALGEGPSGSTLSVEASCNGAPCTAVVSGRRKTWHGLAQDIDTGGLAAGEQYRVEAEVRAQGGLERAATVLATIALKADNGSPSYVTLGSVLASVGKWVELHGTLGPLPAVPPAATVYLEGPPPGVDLLVRRFHVWRTLPDAVSSPSPGSLAPRASPLLPYAKHYGVDVAMNGSFEMGTAEWQTMGGCEALSVVDAIAVAGQDLGSGLPLGRALRVSGRQATWQGPVQDLTHHVHPLLAYRASAWVSVSPGHGAQHVNVALNIDTVPGGWVNAGQVEAVPGKWKQAICDQFTAFSRTFHALTLVAVHGSFRLGAHFGLAKLYIQGPAPGVDLYVARVRQQNVLLHVTDAVGRPVHGARLTMNQTRNSFPLGACLSRAALDSPEYRQFFLAHFNVATLENELKWASVEGSPGAVDFQAADVMIGWLEKHKIPIRAHCIFWEAEQWVQDWVKALPAQELAAAVEKRLLMLLQRYRGKFIHYDVNNEMLHGSFYASRLGSAARAHMFQRCKQLDPQAKLFVNDYHVEDGEDSASTPDKYAEHVKGLVAGGAPVGGVGLQGHIAALDTLSDLQMPIWFTEVDVAHADEHVRADDLEVVLREAFAHPAASSSWGFWETAMSRRDAHLASTNWQLTEAGRRLEELQAEWLTTNVTGITDSAGCFGMRGYHGQYEVHVNDIGGTPLLSQYVTVSAAKSAEDAQKIDIVV
eukprot:SM000365S13726  [mRNA]  locus=s365:6807:11169:- [translate_table: standard]